MKAAAIAAVQATAARPGNVILEGWCEEGVRKIGMWVEEEGREGG